MSEKTFVVSERLRAVLDACSMEQGPETRERYNAPEAFLERWEMVREFVAELPHNAVIEWGTDGVLCLTPDTFAHLFDGIMVHRRISESGSFIDHWLFYRTLKIKTSKVRRVVRFEPESVYCSVEALR